MITTKNKISYFDFNSNRKSTLNDIDVWPNLLQNLYLHRNPMCDQTYCNICILHRNPKTMVHHVKSWSKPRVTHANHLNAKNVAPFLKFCQKMSFHSWYLAKKILNFTFNDDHHPLTWISLGNVHCVQKKTDFRLFMK